MQTVRIMYERGPQVKYISHLDILRVFDRALRRSQLPVAFSSGFNPRPKIVFGLPPGVGVTSKSEYADLTLEQDIDAAEVKKRLNNALPDGFRILEAFLTDGKSNIMAIIDAASYDILAEYGPMNVRNYMTESAGSAAADTVEGTVNGAVLDSFFMGETLFALKKKKDNEEIIDIKPMLYSVNAYKFEKTCYNKLGFGYNVNCSINNEVCPEEVFPRIMQPDSYIEELAFDRIKSGGQSGLLICFCVLVAAGSRGNLKPELVIDALNRFLHDNLDNKLRVLAIHRKGLFVKHGDCFISP